MADVRPLEAVHYELRMVGSLGDVTSPPYDVITPEMRKELVARSPFNVVEVDLPEGPGGADPYEHAAETFDEWLLQDILKCDREPAIWPYAQEFTGPDGATRTRRGFLARVRLEPYGPGGVRPHERTQPGPKEDRLRLTRATRHNLSPIFALHAGDAWQHLEPALGDAWGEATDDDGTVHRVWRIADPAVHEAIAAELADSELLIADGHHRYETARAYEAEVGADDEGPHSFVLMSLVSLEDPGLAVFPTHRLLYDLDPSQYEPLGAGHPGAVRVRGGRARRARPGGRGWGRRLRLRLIGAEVAGGGVVPRRDRVEEQAAPLVARVQVAHRAGRPRLLGDGVAVVAPAPVPVVAVDAGGDESVVVAAHEVVLPCPPVLRRHRRRPGSWRCPTRRRPAR